jgi:hypothetical protein
MAVFYADGNSFGAVRQQVGVKDFSQQLKTLRATLLEKLLEWLCRNANHAGHGDFFAISEAYNGERYRGLRFETLLWGGDEVMFVLPSWLALPFAVEFDRLCQGWSIGDHTLTHAMGMVIAHHKSPIRQLTALAKALADEAKNAKFKDRNTLSIEIFESQYPPDDSKDLQAIRAALYGPTADANSLAASLILPAGDKLLEDGFRRVKELKNTFPRSQLYAALRAARDADHPLTLAAASKAEESLQTYANRMGIDLNKALWSHCLPAYADTGLGSRSKAMDIAMICSLWDYIDAGELLALADTPNVETQP